MRRPAIRNKQTLTLAIFGCLVLTVAFSGCGANDKAFAWAALLEFREGVNSGNRNHLERVLDSEVQLITLYENSTLSRSQFLDRLLIMKDVSNHTTLTFRSGTVVRSLAYFEVFQSSVASIEGREVRHAAVHIYELRKASDKWVIYRIHQLLCC